MITISKNCIIIKENNRGDWGFMFNNINDNDYKQLANSSNVINLASIRSSYQKNNNSTVNPYVDKTEISSIAMKLFQQDLDVKKFTKIVTENKDDISYLEQMQELFSNGVVDPFEEDAVSELLTNSKLWDDLNS